MVEISGEQITMDERQLDTVHVPSIDSLAKTFLAGIVIIDGQSGLVGGANHGRIEFHGDGNRSLVNLNTDEFGNIGRTSDILIDDLHSILVTLNVSSRNRDGVHVVDRITVSGLLVILIPLILILGIVADLIDNSLKDSVGALTNLLRSGNDNVRNRSNQERVDRGDDRGDATLAINLNGELVGELLAIILIDGVNREGQVGRLRTGDAVSIGDVLIVNQPSVGVTLKVIIDNSGKGDDVVLTSSIGTDDVGLQVNHGTDREGIGNSRTTVLAGDSQRVNAIAARRADRNVRSGLAVAPSIGVGTGRSHGRSDGGGGSVSSIILVTAKRHNRSRMHMDGVVRIRDGRVRGLTTVIADRTGLEDIVTSLIQGHSQGRTILAGQLLTVLIPNIRIVVVRVRHLERHLIALTNVVVAQRDVSLGGSVVNVDRNMTIDIAVIHGIAMMLRSIRGLHIISSSGGGRYRN